MMARDMVMDYDLKFTKTLRSTDTIVYPVHRLFGLIRAT
ncbi:hypothetical protein DET54_101109 [Paenibacillus pabuli]|uniref:Uncharacterized protein n=1 Tax=Paenibacillus pabuli TaxID=1472 RepID=A0A855Y1D0_9BACL|nr:hypothetical protein DET56_11633 [Paenibacillus pabuli]PXW00594.1 hypothetical protein DEU73_115116 [Paenibacillus taichungensis]RAJ02914.1 hypothetical protein DET54_101109 [Paenibacillus pabuli]